MAGMEQTVMSKVLYAKWESKATIISQHLTPSNITSDGLGSELLKELCRKAG